MGEVYISQSMDFIKCVDVPDEVIAQGRPAIYRFIADKQDHGDPDYTFQGEDFADDYGLEVYVPKDGERDA